ncbi:MAG TPA: cell wall-active antibiotics response protein LiaF [bacterium]|nr:cell wall-active antibiotics response protein LiaF [bacterium]HQG45627.1 cell wall-active antibiotics response protein LiaF [bacterium]HQI49597.1 cell wall-active antibiotics response protein LiaF [bacterium]HQJ63269.1 cell wall-active antibiotics response protein LiaF [bacterium]
MDSQSNRGSTLLGVVLVVIGCLLLFNGPSLFDIIRWFFRFWPVALIGLGLYLVLGGRRGDEQTPGTLHEDEPEFAGTLSRDSAIGDLRIKLPARGFNGGSVKTLVGSVVIDASQVAMEPGEHRLYLRSGVGDVHVDLLPGLPVKVKARVSLGDIKVFDQKAEGFNQALFYQTPKYEEMPARLLLICSVGLGDIKVF